MSLPARPPRRWRSIITISAARVIDDTEGSVMTNLFPLIQPALKLSNENLGQLVSIGRFARMLFGPLWAMLADRLGRKNVLVFVTGVWGIWTAAVGFAQDFNQLLLLYGLGALGTVAGEPIVNGLIADFFRDKERGKAYGAVRFFQSFGSLLLTPVFAAFAQHDDGWRWGMFVMGGLSVFSGLLIWWLVDEPERPGGQNTTAPAADSPLSGSTFDLRGLWKLVQIPTIVLLAINLPMVTSLVLNSFFVVFFVQVRAWTTSDAQWLVATFSAGWMISSLLGGLLGDWFQRRFGVQGRIVLMQIYLAVFSLCSFLALQIAWQDTPVTVAMVLLLGLVGSIGFSGVVLPMVSHVTPPAFRSTAFALLFSFLQGMLAAGLSWAVGRLADTYGYQMIMFWVVTVPYALNAVYWTVFYFFYPRDYQRNEALLAELTER